LAIITAIVTTTPATAGGDQPNNQGHARTDQQPLTCFFLFAVNKRGEKTGLGNWNLKIKFADIIRYG
jgi:hypothetical protein